MDVKNSSEQLMEKIKVLSDEISTFSMNVLVSSCEAIQRLLSDFRLPEKLELIVNNADIPKPKRRKTRLSRITKGSIASITRGKKRKLAESSLEESRTCSMVSTSTKSNLTLESVPEDSSERDQVEATPKVKRPRQTSINPVPSTITKPKSNANVTYVRIEDPSPETVDDAAVSAIPDITFPIFKVPTTSSKRPLKTPDSISKQNRSLKLKTPQQHSSPPLEPIGAVSPPPLPKRSSTRNSSTVVVDAAKDAVDIFRRDHNSGFMTEESSEDISATAISPSHADASAKPLPIISAPTLPPRPPVMVRPVVSSPVVGLVGGSLNSLATKVTPWSSSAGPNWLSRLGWFNNTSNQQQLPVAAASSTRQKSVVAKQTPFPRSGTGGPVMRTLTRLPTGTGSKTAGMGRKINCSVISEKSFVSTTCAANKMSTAAAAAGPSTATATINKSAAVEERRLRVISGFAAKTDRARRLEQQREDERRARVKANDAHRQAVRANAERVAQEKKAAFARKVEAEEQRMQKLKEKQQQQRSSPSKPSTSLGPRGVSGIGGGGAGGKPLSIISTNVVPALSGNDLKTFDWSQPPPPTTQTTQLLRVVLEQPKEVKKQSLMSYDLAGILSDYNSDSDEEGPSKSKAYPTWARPGNAELLQWVGNIYKNKVSWKNVFRPAEQVNIPDVELFHGYQYKVRTRGSSAVWQDS